MNTTTSTLAVLAAAATLAMVGPATAQIKIGASFSATGPAAYLGTPEMQTLAILVEQANAAGGINGQQIELIYYDDAGDPTKAQTFATRLIEDDGVVAVIGGTTTGTSMSILAVTEDAKIPFISLAGATNIIDPVKPYTFKTPPTDRMACQKIFEDMQRRGITKIGMISGTDGFGASMQAQCQAVVGDYGIEILADETYAPLDVDMTAQLTNIRSTVGVEAIVNPGFGQGPAVVTRNYSQLGIEMPLYQSHGVASDGFIELASAEAAEGVILPGGPLLVVAQLDDSDPQKAVIAAYKAAFEEQTATPVGTFGGYAHDAYLILVDALKRSASTEPADIRDAIEATSGLVGVTGAYTFTPDDHLGLDLTSFRILQIKDGAWTIVE